MQEAMSPFPSTAEAMSYAKVMRLVKGIHFSVVVFDTAPTGHTLRLLSFPMISERGVGRRMHIKNQISPFISQMCNMRGHGEMNAGLQAVGACHSLGPGADHIHLQVPVCTRPSGWSSSWPSAELTCTTPSSTSWSFQTGPARCTRSATRSSPNTWARWRICMRISTLSNCLCCLMRYEGQISSTPSPSNF